jgi:hypothetical protein
MITEGNKILLIEERIKNDVKIKKIEKKQQKTQDESDYAEVYEYINTEYPDGLDKIKNKKWIEDGVSLIPMKCTKCLIYKVFPYDFMATNGRDYGTNHCKTCTKIINKPCKKYQETKKIICECGICYIGTDLAIANHITSQQHKDRLAEMIIGVRYTKKDLIKLSSIFKITYYKKLNREEMIAKLRPKMEYDFNNNTQYTINEDTGILYKRHRYYIKKVNEKREGFHPEY